MSRSMNQHPRSRAPGRPWWALLLVLPTVLLGTASATGLLLLHEHDHHGLHTHAVQEHPAGDVAVHGHRHHGEPAEAHHDAGGNADSFPFTGVVVEWPTWTFVRAPTRQGHIESLLWPTASPIIGAADPGGFAPVQAQPPDDSWPGLTAGSGAARVLRANHALLI